MTPRNKVTLRTKGESGRGAEVTLNGKKLEGVRYISIDCGFDQVNIVKLEFIAEVDAGVDTDEVEVAETT